MKTLVVYYSLEGNTKLIAQTLKEELNCDIVELKPEFVYIKGKIDILLIKVYNSSI